MNADLKELYGSMYVEEPLRLSTVVDEALRQAQGRPEFAGLKILENERLNNGICRLKVARFGEDVDVDELIQVCGLASDAHASDVEDASMDFSLFQWNDSQVWPIEEPEKPEEGEALMFYAYLVWRSADE